MGIQNYMEPINLFLVLHIHFHIFTWLYFKELLTWKLKFILPFYLTFFHWQYFKLELVSLCSLTTSFLFQTQCQVGGQKYCKLVMIGSMSEEAGMLDDVS